MKTKFMIVASLGLLFALQSQADPIRAGILMGAGVAIGTINKAKCSFADEKFNAMEVKAPYVNLSTSTINQAKSAPKMTGLIYYDSDQVPQNVAKAKEWYLKAIEYKHPVAAYNLGVINEDENHYKKAILLSKIL